MYKQRNCQNHPR